MFSFLTADFNLLYSSALLFVLFIALLEVFGLIMGLSIVSSLDDIISFDLDIDGDAELSVDGLTGIIGWLYLHRLPFLVWLILFLTSFGIAGLALNYIVQLPTLISLPVALLTSVLSCRILGRKLAIIMPKNETSAVSSHSFSGKVATITVGKAKKGSPAEAVLRDDFQQKHYILVEPDAEGKVFSQGTKVLLIEKLSTSWVVVEFEAL